MRKITIGSMYKIVFIFIIIKQFFIKPVSIRYLFTQPVILKTFAYNIFIEFIAFLLLSLALIAISGIFGNKFIK